MTTFKNQPVLVTGGAGFIGSHIVDALVAAGARVRVLDNFSHGSRDNLAHHGQAVDIIDADIRDPAACARAVAGVTYLFHLAALGSVPRSVEQPILYNDVNVNGTLNVLEAARLAKVTRVIYSSSSSAYGDAPVLPKIESMPPSPKSPYAVTKLVGEHYCRAYSACYGLSTISLRYFNIFGPRQNPHSQYAAVIPAFIEAIRHNRPVTIYGDGEQTRDFCYVANAVHANLLAAACAKPLAGEVVNVACAQRTSLNQMLNLMSEKLEKPVKKNLQDSRLGDVRDSLADISAAEKLLGYRPQVLFAQGLELTLQAYLSPTQ